MLRPCSIVLLFILTMLSAPASETLPAPASAYDFDKDIKPILLNSCIQCHSGAKPKGGLSLETRELLLKGGKDGKSIIIGDSAKSPLIRYVAQLEEDLEMPPKGKGVPLTAQQIALLRVWIDQGAKWPDGLKLVPKISDDTTKSVVSNPAEPRKVDPQKNRSHWAFHPPVKPALPELHQFASKVQSPIDAFVLARLEKEGLAPSPQASKMTLLRRLSLDLTGLPPTIAEVDAFLADTSPDAYQKQVNRLLASPHYGERWARHWLDAARYADSDGFEKDKPRFAWAYRDWVINAFNKNLPYDQFVIEQIAGDELPNAAQDDIVATGFLRNSMINEEGGIHPEQFRMEAMFDRMDAIGKSVLGLSIACAQCHNHKFDPLTQEEYYCMFAFLNNDHEASTAVYTSEQLMQNSDILRRIAEIEGELKHMSSDWPAHMAEWEKSAKVGQPEWVVLHPEAEDISTGGQKYLPQPDGSLVAAGYAPTKHTVKLMATRMLRGYKQFVLSCSLIPICRSTARDALLRAPAR